MRTNLLEYPVVKPLSEVELEPSEPTGIETRDEMWKTARHHCGLGEEKDTQFGRLFLKDTNVEEHLSRIKEVP